MWSFVKFSCQFIIYLSARHNPTLLFFSLAVTRTCDGVELVLNVIFFQIL